MISCTTGLLRIIHQYFPICGHNLFPCGCDFTVVIRVDHRQDHIYPTQHYEIRDAKKKQPLLEVKKKKLKIN